MRQLSATTAAQRGGEKPLWSASTEKKTAAAPYVSEADLHSGWQSLQRDLALKTEQLESILKRRKSGVRSMSDLFVCLGEEYTTKLFPFSG